MKTLAFLQTPEITRLLARAARCASAPVSIHSAIKEKEEFHLASHGHSPACAFISKLPGGQAACRRSRQKAQADAMRLNEATPFICHMGFACVTVIPQCGATREFALTIGPYCPNEGLNALTSEAEEGLAALHAKADKTFTETLKKIPILPATVVPATAEWTADELRRLWEATIQTDPIPEPEQLTPAPRKKARATKSRAAASDPYQAKAIAAALAGGAKGQARALAKAALEETESAKRTKASVRRARALALVCAVMEASERAALSSTTCRAKLPEFIKELDQARTELQILNAVMKILSALKRKAAREIAHAQDYEELNALLIPRLIEGITLNEIAETLKQSPTAITHRLQRKFGMSFSEYLGRLRIDKAKELLRRTRLSIVEVARRVGVDDSSNFTKLFIKFESMPPRKYREQFGRK
jgi:AraC-like DNA-binding protein